MAKLLAFTLPLCLDNFSVAFAVLGEMRMTRAQQVRVIALFVAFEAAMPLVGMALGAPLTHLAGSPAHLTIDPYQVGSATEAKELALAQRSHLAETIDLTFVGRYIVPFVVPVIIACLGIVMLDEAFNDDDDDDESEKARAMMKARGWNMVWLGLSISIDELVVGFTLGYDGLSVPLVIVTIVVQAFLAIVIGQYVGRRAREGKLKLSSQRVAAGSRLVAGTVLVGLSVVLLIGPQVTTHLFPHLIHHKVVRLTTQPSAVSTTDGP